MDAPNIRCRFAASSALTGSSGRDTNGALKTPPAPMLRARPWNAWDNRSSVAAGRLLGSGKPAEIQCVSGRVKSVRLLDCQPDGLPWIAPGLIDLQVNGFAGVDFQSDSLREEDLLRASSGLEQAGCRRFFLTLITAPWSDLLARLKHLRNIRDACPRLRQSIAGWHIEGPFLSSEPGFHGAHDPKLMRDPSIAMIRELRRMLPDDRILLTLAPERAGAAACIREAAKLGMRISLGHTNASAAQLRAAAAAGASGFTHLGNGCPQSWDRHDNILLRVLNMDSLRIGLIPDAIHVSPDLFRIIHRSAARSRLWYVSDAMSAGGMPPGKYPLAGMLLEAGRDQAVRKPGSPLFAGSALKPLDGVSRAAEMLGESWRKTFRRFCHQPAAWMGMSCSLKPGCPAPVILEVRG